MIMRSHHFLVELRVAMGAGAPAVTVFLVRKMLQVVLPMRELDEAGVIADIERAQQPSCAACRSH